MKDERLQKAEPCSFKLTERELETMRSFLEKEIFLPVLALPQSKEKKN